ncbi:MAG: hypothetical protein JWL91_1339 [Sphingomonas bacterium]|nr:hypothetical protein [Sphingomonas bacterium]
MLKRVTRLFVIKTRIDAYLVIYALAVGGVERGRHYFDQFPGIGGYLLFLACTGTVFMAGAKILDAVPSQRRAAATLPADRRRRDNPPRDRRQHDRRHHDRRHGGRRAVELDQAARERPA